MSYKKTDLIIEIPKSEDNQDNEGGNEEASPQVKVSGRVEIDKKNPYLADELSKIIQNRKQNCSTTQENNDVDETAINQINPKFNFQVHQNIFSKK